MGDPKDLPASSESGQRPECRLCHDSGEHSDGDVWATIPMCGRRPRYPLCLRCYDDIAAECEDVRPIEAVPSGSRRDPGSPPSTATPGAVQ